MPNQDSDITIGSNIATNVSVGNTNGTITIGSNDASITIGNANNSVNAGDHDHITVGDGNHLITVGSGDTLTVGNGSITITAGDNDVIVGGYGQEIITAGQHSTITVGSGNDRITAGPDSTISTGNGSNNVHAGANTVMTFGSGPDTVSAGTSDTINLSNGPASIKYDGLTPSFTAPASLTVEEEHSVALPITILPPSLGSEVINGFKTANGVIGFDKTDFANFSAVMAAATQVGANTVIALDTSDSLTLTNVSKSSLSSSNFVFFDGATDVVTITGVPLDATLSAGTDNGGGSWTLTPAQLAGLELNAGEPIGYPTPTDLTVTITNPAGQGASSSTSIPLVVEAIPPSVGVSVLPYQLGDPITEVRLELTAATDDPDGGDDYINRFELSGLPTGVTLTTGTGAPISISGGLATIPSIGTPGSVSTEVDLFVPAQQTSIFDVGITAFADEPNSPEVSSSTSQNIDVEYEPATANPVFTASGQSIWQSGPGFSATYQTFLGIDFPSGYPTNPAASDSGTVLGVTVGGSFGLRAGFESDLSLNSGAFNGTLPFSVTLANTFNKTNDTLEIDPNDTQGTADFNTTSPQGTYSLDFVFDAFLRAFAGSLSIATGGSTDINLVHINSSTLTFTANLPDGIGTIKLAWPTVNTTGSGGGSTISASGTSNPIFSVNVDPIAVISDILLGSDPFKGGGGLNLGLASLSFTYTLAAGTVEPTISLQQSFNLNDLGLVPTLTDNGNPVPFAFGTPTVIQGAPLSNSFDLGLSPDATLENDTSLLGQLILGLTLLKATAKATELFGAGSQTATIGPLFHPTTTINLGSVPLYKNTFPVSFGSQDVNFSVA